MKVIFPRRALAVYELNNIEYSNNHSVETIPISRTVPLTCPRVPFMLSVASNVEMFHIVLDDQVILSRLHSHIFLQKNPKLMIAFKVYGVNMCIVSLN